MIFSKDFYAPKFNDGGLPRSLARSRAGLSSSPARLLKAQQTRGPRPTILRRSLTAASSVAAAVGHPCGKLAPGIVWGTVASWVTGYSGCWGGNLTFIALSSLCFDLCLYFVSVHRVWNFFHCEAIKSYLPMKIENPSF